MLRLLSALERRFDRIILDCAPVLPVADTLALSDRVGGFILVVRSQHTPRESVVRVASLLGVDRLLGLILNSYVSRLPGGDAGTTVTATARDTDHRTVRRSAELRAAGRSWHC